MTIETVIIGIATVMIIPIGWEVGRIIAKVQIHYGWMNVARWFINKHGW